MSAGRLRSLVEAGLVVVSGLTFGLGVSTLSFHNFPAALLLPVALLLGLAAVGEWLEVKLKPFGSFTLRPVIAFVALWEFGSGPFMIVGLAPMLLVGFFRRSPRTPELLVASGREALALWAGPLLLFGLGVWLRTFTLSDVLVSVLERSGSLLGYWSLRTLLVAAEATQSEGVRFATSVSHLVRRISPDAMILTAASVALSFARAEFGLAVMGIAAVFLVETYYPRKLLGEQDGVLFTSLQMMAQAVDLKDPYTSNHSQRVSRSATRLARALGLPEEDVERIRIGGLMHDIGKIGISGRIIRKPAKLTPEEKALMNQHSSLSAEIIEHLEIIGQSADMVRHHHEHRNGSGYPDGLKGDRIPIGSRIILVADAFDALTTDRPYRKGADPEKAVTVIRENAGTQFDETVVTALERIYRSL